MKELKKRGVRVLPGGDYGFAWNPIGTNARDIEHFVNLLGFSPMDAILSATKLGGEIMMAGNELGQVKPGYLADMILVDGNPVANVKILQDADQAAGDHEGRAIPQGAADSLAVSAANRVRDNKKK